MILIHKGKALRLSCARMSEVAEEVAGVALTDMDVWHEALDRYARNLLSWQRMKSVLEEFGPVGELVVFNDEGEEVDPTPGDEEGS